MHAEPDRGRMGPRSPLRRAVPAFAGLVSLLAVALVPRASAEELEVCPFPIEDELHDEWVVELPEFEEDPEAWDGYDEFDRTVVAAIDGDRTTVRLGVEPFSDVRLNLRSLDGELPLVLAVRDEWGNYLSTGVRKRARGRARGEVFSVGPTVYVDVVLTNTGGYSEFELEARVLGGDFWEDPWGKGHWSVPGTGPDDPLWSPGGMVVCSEGGFDPELLAAELGFGYEALWDGVGRIQALPAGFDTADWLESLYPGLICVEPDGRATLPDGSQANGIVLGSRFGRKLDEQSALNRVRARPAHRRSEGANVVVAVLDTGVDATHPELAGRVLPGMDFVENDADPSETRDWTDGDEDGQVDEGFGHGTFIAGLVLLTAPEAEILPVRVLDDDGRGTSSSVAAGIRYAVASGADVINLSLGMPVYSEIVADAIRTARAQGVVVVAATGNDGRRALVDFPSSEPGVIPVRALGVGGRRADFANGTRSRTVSAPGRNLRGPVPGGGYGRASGTSFATPLVSGGVALYLARNPGATSVEAERAVLRRWRLNLKQLTR